MFRNKEKATFSDEEIEGMQRLVEKLPIRYDNKTMNQIYRQIGFANNKKRIPLIKMAGKTVKVKGAIINVISGSSQLITPTEIIISNQYDNCVVNLLTTLDSSGFKPYHNSEETGLYIFKFEKPVIISINRVKFAHLFHRYRFGVN